MNQAAAARMLQETELIIRLLEAADRNDGDAFQQVIDDLLATGSVTWVPQLALLCAHLIRRIGQHEGGTFDDVLTLIRLDAMKLTDG